MPVISIMHNLLKYNLNLLFDYISEEKLLFTP